MSSTLHHKDDSETAWHHSQGPRVFLPVPTSRKNSETWGTSGEPPKQTFLGREIADAGGLRLSHNPSPTFPYFAGSSPNTPTPVVVPTYTFPWEIMGVMYLFPAPK
jgi:hypothetical protein